MTYNDFIASMEQYGSNRKDICMQFLGVEEGKISESVIIAPWWEPRVFCSFWDKIEYVSKSESAEIKIWNLEEKSLISTFIAINKEGNYEYITYSPDNSYTYSDGGREFIVFEKIK